MAIFVAANGFGTTTTVVNSNTYTAASGQAVAALATDVPGLLAAGWSLVPGYLDTAVASGSSQNSSPLTGATIALPSSVTLLSLTPAGTIAALTVTAPASPADAQLMTITTTQTVTTLTVNANTSVNANQTISSTFATSLTAALFSIAYQYCAATSTWIRVK